MPKTLLIVFCSLILHLESSAFAQVKQDKIPVVFTYKKFDTLDLNLIIYIITGRYAFRSSLKKGFLGGYSPPLIENERFTIADL